MPACRPLQLIIASLLTLQLAIGSAAASSLPAERQPEHAEQQPRVASIIIGIVGVAVSVGFGLATLDGSKVSLNNIDLTINDTHFHVGDERKLRLRVDFSVGNLGYSSVLNQNDHGMAIIRAYSEGTLINNTTRDYYGNTVNNMGGRNINIDIDTEGINFGNTSVLVTAEACGHNYGAVVDDYACRSDQKTIDFSVLAPVVERLNPESGAFFVHPGTTNFHTLKAENHSSKPVWLYTNRVNTALLAHKVLPAGQDFGSATTTDVMIGSVMHLVGGNPAPEHVGTPVPLQFNWGSERQEMFLRRRPWINNQALKSGTDTCISKGGHIHDSASPALELFRGGTTLSSGCQPTRLNQWSDAPTTFTLEGQKVIITNNWPAGTLHEVTVDASNQFCWSNLNLNETVDVVLNWDGEETNIETTVLQDVPLAALGTTPQSLFTEFNEAGVDDITGTLLTNDGTPIRVAVYSRRPGFPDWPIGLTQNGNFTISGRGQLEFNGQNSQLVFVPIPTDRRTLASSDPVVEDLDVTYTDTIELFNTVQFDYLPPTTGPVTMKGTYVDENGSPISGLTIEVRDAQQSGNLVTSDVTNGLGEFEFTVPNGTWWVGIPNMESFDLRPMPFQEIDFALKGLPTWDIGVKTLYGKDETSLWVVN